MFGGAEVLRGEGAGERADRLLVGDLDQLPLAALELEQAAEVVGVEEQLLLGPLVGHQPEGPLEEAAGELLDERQEIERAERLLQERLRACLQRGGLARVAAREDHD